MLPRIPIKTLIIAGVFLTLASCSVFRPAAPTPFYDAVATQVAVMLTSSPAVINTQPPVATASSPSMPTAAPATATKTPQPPTATLQPTLEATLTKTPKPTSTQVEGDPRLSLGDPTFQDVKFNVDENWGGPWKDKFTQGQFKNDELVLTSIGVDGWTVTWPKIQDFYLEMTATTGDCSGMDRYGLVVRVPETFDRGYLYGFTCDGQYSFRIWDPVKKQYNYLIKWTHSDAINTGSNETNRIGLKGEGDKFSLYANGKLIDTISDSRFDAGHFGPYIGHAETQDFTIYIKEIAYWDLSQ